MQIIVSSIILLVVIALIIGFFLGVSSYIFKVEVNETAIKIRACLPGNNCGGCGYAGCDAVAEAIAKKEAPVNACPVGGAKVAKQISEIMGVDAGSSDRFVAFVHCDGTCVNSKKAYEYNGVKDCKIASSLPNNGDKKCVYACLGYGTCVNACKFDAIHIVDGVAKVDEEKCVACKACINACPMKVIELVPYGKTHKVKCSNKDKGKLAMDVCAVSCIACGMCEKNCPKKAITMVNNIPVMDYAKCDDCGTCAEKCPRKCITKNDEKIEKSETVEKNERKDSNIEENVKEEAKKDE